MTEQQETNKKTLVILAHPNVEGSSSHQFLIQTGQRYGQVDYLDIASYYNQDGGFQADEEVERLLRYDRIIFQFQLFWYQAPAILKIWMDQVFNYQIIASNVEEILKGKELGVVVITGTKGSDYERGGRHNVTLSELLSPYQAFAKYWGMTYLPHFSLHQLNLMTDSQKHQAMLDYIVYLNEGYVDSFRKRQQQLIHILHTIESKDGQRLVESHPTFQALVNTIETQQDQLYDLFDVSKEG